MATLNWWGWDGHRPPLGWFIVDFLVFVTVLTALVLRPLRAFMQERHVKIKQSISDAASAHARAARGQSEARDHLAQAEAHTRQLLEESRADGELERQKSVQQATETARRMAQDSGTIGAQEAQRLQASLRREMAAVVMGEAQRLLAAELDEATQGRLLEEALGHIESGTAWAATETQSSAPARLG